MQLDFHADNERARIFFFWLLEKSTSYGRTSETEPVVGDHQGRQLFHLSILLPDKAQKKTTPSTMHEADFVDVVMETN